MKKLLPVILTLLFSYTGFASSVSCLQGDGDDWYALKFNDASNTKVGNAIIVHTLDDDLSEVIYTGPATYYPDSETISAGRFILNYGGAGHNVDIFDIDASLYIRNGQKKTLLSDIMECQAKEISDKDWLAYFDFR